MGTREDLTIIVARSPYMSGRRYRIPHKLLISFGIAAAVICATFILSTLHYYYMWKQTADHVELKASAYQLDKENEALRQELLKEAEARDTKAKRLRSGFQVFSGGPD